MKRTFVLLLAVAALTSCKQYKLHSPGVTITTVNNSQQQVNAIEIDYPGGSYGIGSLPPGGSHVRWIKATGAAPLRIDFTDSRGEHEAKPLSLQADESGAVVLHIHDDGSVTFEDKRTQK